MTRTRAFCNPLPHKFPRWSWTKLANWTRSRLSRPRDALHQRPSGARAHPHVAPIQGRGISLRRPGPPGPTRHVPRQSVRSIVGVYPASEKSAASPRAAKSDRPPTLTTARRNRHPTRSGRAWTGVMLARPCTPQGDTIVSPRRTLGHNRHVPDPARVALRLCSSLGRRRYFGIPPNSPVAATPG